MNIDSTLRNEFGKTQIQSFGQLGRSGIGERGASPLSAIAQQSELADNQGGSTDIDQRAVHFLLIVLEDSQFHGFMGQPSGILVRVVMSNANQNEYAMVDFSYDLAADRNTSGSDPLKHDSHVDNSMFSKPILDDLVFSGMQVALDDNR